VITKGGFLNTNQDYWYLVDKTIFKINKTCISENALMAIEEFTKVLAVYVFQQLTSREGRWFGERLSIPNFCET
jgi:hypothetical protein